MVKKKSVVYVMDGDKVKRVTFGDPNMRIKKNPKRSQEVILEQGTTAIILDQKQRQDIGLAKHGSMAPALAKIAKRNRKCS